jgi:hypothetical protein
VIAVEPELEFDPELELESEPELESELVVVVPVAALVTCADCRVLAALDVLPVDPSLAMTPKATANVAMAVAAMRRRMRRNRSRRACRSACARSLLEVGVMRPS